MFCFNKRKTVSQFLLDSDSQPFHASNHLIKDGSIQGDFLKKKKNFTLQSEFL